MRATGPELTTGAQPATSPSPHRAGTDHLTGTGNGIHEAPGAPSRAAAV
ncbi:hypothetical protein [Streptomyces lydicus]